MEQNPSQIANLSDDDFRELTIKHLHQRDGDPRVWEALLSPELIYRTFRLLTDLIDLAEAAARKKKVELNNTRIACLGRGKDGTTEWLHAQALHEQWKSRNGNFKSMVERRLTEVRHAKGVNRRVGKAASRDERLAGHAELMARERQQHAEVIRALALMIQRHQASKAAAGQTPEQFDYDLWRLLDELGVPNGPERELVSLRQMLTVYWFETTPATVAGGQRRQAERMMKQAPAGRGGQYVPPKARHAGPAKPLA